MPRPAAASDALRLGFGWWEASVHATCLAVDSQAVLAYRALGLAGLWPVAPSERGRMLDEKAPAFAIATRSALRAAGRGLPADRVVLAALRPIGRRARANARRLGRTR